MSQDELLAGLSEQEKYLLGKVLEIEKRYQGLTELSTSREKDIVSEIVALFKKVFQK